MAANPLIDPGPSPSISVATEEIGGVQFPLTKLVDATVGSSTPIGTTANPLPVTDSSTSTRKVKGETAVGGAVGDPVPIGTRDLASNTLQVPHTFNFGGVQYLLALVPDPSLNFVSYSSGGEQYALTGSTDGTKANSRYTRVSTAGNPLIAGDVAHDAIDSGNPIKMGGVASSGVPTAVAPGDRVNAYYDKQGYQHVRLDQDIGTTTFKGSGHVTGIIPYDGYLGDEGCAAIVGTDGGAWNPWLIDSGGIGYVGISGTANVSTSIASPGVTTGTFTAVSQTVVAAISGHSSVVIQVSGTYVATMIWEISFDGTNYFGFSAKRVDTETLETTTGALTNTTRAWEASINGAANVRLRCSAYTSGTVSVRIRTSQSAVEPSVVATVASGTIGTVTNITNQGHLADNAAFTDGTTRVMMAGYIFDETAGTALTENDAGASRIDSKRAQVFTLEDSTTRGRRQVVNANGGASANLMYQNHAQTFTATGAGTTVNCSTNPFKHFSIQVKGTGAAPTSWDIVVEGSLDGTNFSTLVSHGTADGDGFVKGATSPVPVLYFRSRCVALTLGGATNAIATILGMQ